MFLITGNLGFIGSHLQKDLEKNGYDVFGIDLRNLGYHHDLKSVLTSVPWERIEKIFHLGAITDTTIRDPNIFHTFNVEFTKQLLDWADKRMIPIHYASSAAVYGNSRENKPNPLNQYALSKLIIDYYVRDHEWNTNVVGLRFFNVYGFDESMKTGQQSLINKLIHAKEPSIFKSSISYWRDFVCVEDVVRVLQNTYKNGIYDIGTGNAENIQELADIIMQYTGKDYSLVPMPKELKKQYQEYTKAKFHPDEHYKKFNYMTVKDWLWENREKIKQLV